MNLIKKLYLKSDKRYKEVEPLQAAFKNLYDRYNKKYPSLGGVVRAIDRGEYPPNKYTEYHNYLNSEDNAYITIYQETWYDIVATNGFDYYINYLNSSLQKIHTILKDVIDTNDITAIIRNEKLKLILQ